MRFTYICIGLIFSNVLIQAMESDKNIHTCLVEKRDAILRNALLNRKIQKSGDTELDNKIHELHVKRTSIWGYFKSSNIPAIAHYAACNNLHKSFSTLVQKKWIDIYTNPEENRPSWGSDLLITTYAQDAAMYNSPDIIRILIDHKAPLDQETEFMDSPIEVAANYGNVAVVRLLLKCVAYTDLYKARQYTTGDQCFKIGSLKRHTENFPIIKQLIDDELEKRLTNKDT